MIRGRRKALYRKERDWLEGIHEEAEIERKVFKKRKHMAFSKDTCSEKERVGSKRIPKKVGVALKRKEG